ncbi:MAG: hypothetical protein ABIC82_04935 [bacterium]
MKNINIYIKIIFIALVISICFFVFIDNIPVSFFTENTVSGRGIKLIKDPGDFEVYFLRSFLFIGESPNGIKNFSEYPQLALLFLTIPRFFVDNFFQYTKTLIIMLSLCFISFLIVNIKLLKKINNNINYIWLLFLPSVIYFTFNRFDIFPALLVQISLLLFFTKKYKSSFFVVGLAILAKWYAFLLLPILFIYLKDRISKKKIYNLFLILFFTIIIPFFITLYCRGLLSVFEPYIFHSMRGKEPGSLYALVPNFYMIKYIFIFLQFIGIFFVLLKAKIQNYKDIINWSAVLIMVFILFCPIFSPQWIIWFLPLLVLTADTKKLVFLIIFYDLINYLQFPILHNINYSSYIFNIVVVIRSIFLIFIILEISKKLKINNFKNKNISKNEDVFIDPFSRNRVSLPDT